MSHSLNSTYSGVGDEDAAAAAERISFSAISVSCGKTVKISRRSTILLSG